LFSTFFNPHPHKHSTVDYSLICSGVAVYQLWSDKAWPSLERTRWSLACSGHSVSARGKQWITINKTHMDPSQSERDRGWPLVEEENVRLTLTQRTWRVSDRTLSCNSFSMDED